jgi:hypothetical protein
MGNRITSFKAKPLLNVLPCEFILQKRYSRIICLIRILQFSRFIKQLIHKKYPFTDNIF